MKNLLTAAFALGILFSCNKTSEKVSTETVHDTVSVPKTEKATTAENPLKLEVFPFPQEIQGCSCYFAASKEDFEKEKYIYADDYGNSAFVKIGEKVVKFPMKEGDFDPSDFNKTISNGEYTLKMTGKKIEEASETMMFTGELTVENKNGEKYSTPVYGECGC